MGHDLGPSCLVSLPLGLGSCTENCFTCHMNTQLGRVEHLDTENVVLATVPCSKRFGHCRDTYSQKSPFLLCLFLLLQEVFIPNSLQPDVQAFAVLPGISEKPKGCPMGEIVITNEIEPSKLCLVDAEVIGCGLHHPFLEEHGLSHTERATVGNTARCLVRIDTPCGEVSCRNVVTGEC